ncbi:hypothetical protein S40288_03720 [Stachybotrys chartarum IBT 40288]|nr:hypothetical protein S40288_03720 [Stachybotrys chartarum IBT 40288]
MTTTDLSILNPNPIKLPGPQLLHELVKPVDDSTALEYLEHSRRTSYSYKQLHERAETLAWRITQSRAATGGTFVVPVLMQQSPELYISLLAILKAGGAFCPLNIDAPLERLRFILNDVSAKAVLVTRNLASKIPNENGLSILVVDAQDEAPNASFAQHRVPSPDDLAYVMYTSGSTGTPKGVGISHSAATQALLAHHRHIPSFSKFLQFAAPTFDVSVFEIFFPLFRGRTLVSIQRQQMLDDLPGVIRQMNVDACELTPTVAGGLLRKRDHAPCLKLVLTIGEMLSSPVVQEFGGDSSRNSILWAMYGPTEATIHCTVQPAFLSDSPIGNIGAPLDTVSCFVIQPAESPESSQDFQIVPLGEVGELAVGGHQLAAGYLNRPDQTASSFISSPYGRVYRTGDRARLLPSGTLECLGRISDGQVKLRGQRLELGEVEHAALKTTGCHTAVAAVVDSILVAFCAVDDGTTRDTILESCRKWLPGFMVPGDIITMADLPKLPSGKVDKKRLCADFQEAKNATADDDDLRLEDGFDGALMDAISKTLGSTLTMDTSLASIGIDSLVAIRLSSSLRASGFNISASRLLETRTAADLCVAVQAGPAIDDTTSSPVNISMLANSPLILEQHQELRNSIQGEVIDIFPCTSLQSAMIVETMQNPQMYCNEIEFEVVSGITASQVSAALHTLASQHQMLRTGFTTGREGIVSLLFGSIRPGQIETVSHFDTNFALSTPQSWLRPWRFQILQPSLQLKVRVLVHIHHALYDGWSFDMLLEDLSSHLSGYEAPFRRPFQDVIRFYKSPARSQEEDHARAYWSEYLRGWSRAPFPKLNAYTQTSNGLSSVRSKLNIKQNFVESMARAHGVSSQVFFQAGLAMVWSAIHGLSDLVIGCVTSGRSIPLSGIEKIVGPCIASLPLRIDLGRTEASLDLLRTIQSHNRAVMDYCILSLAEIKKLVDLQTPDGLYDVLFAYQETLNSNAGRHNLVKEVRHVDRLETKILVEVEPHTTHFQVQVTYDSAFVSQDLTNLLLSQFEKVVRSLLDKPQEPTRIILSGQISDLSIYNGQTITEQHDLDLAGIFEQAVQRDPTTNAICFAQSLNTEPPNMTVLTYGCLNVNANKIAHFLRHNGVSPGQVVAIIMEKSINLYASILGIVKAGCGYLPVLPSTPLARIQDIFNQAKVRYCLTDDTSSTQPLCFDGMQVFAPGVEELDAFSGENLGIKPDGSRLAYVIYTSGTTGVPKGVAVTQENIVSNITFLGQTYPINNRRSARLLQACSQAFDVSVFEIFFTWHAGMCLCAGTNDLVFEDLERTINQFQITHLSLTPTVASLIDRKNVPSVEFLVTAGEPLTHAVLENWGELLWQGYGPSETTNICSVKKMRPGEHTEHLGWVFSNTSAFVMSPNGCEPLPKCWVGEFCFGGSQVAHGYLNMPELTAEKFIMHPQYGRIYRSGDMGRMLPDGSLVILGRIDDQIKLRGQRIEAEEISGLITMSGLVSSAVTTLAQRHNGAAEQLVSFYVPKSHNNGPYDRALDVLEVVHNQLVSALQTRLPSYMIPSYLIPVSHIPLTTSGKVDRRQLRRLFRNLDLDYLQTTSSDGSRDATNDSNWNASEIAIADVVADSLETSRADIGRWTAFATLGLDSISAIKVSRQLHTRLKKRVPISAILQNSNVVQLARVLDQSSSTDFTTRSSSTRTLPSSFISDVQTRFLQKGQVVSQVLPCTPLQEAMLSRGQGSYYNKVLLRLRVNPETMKEYWNAMFQRHGILRTCFITTELHDTAIVQVVLTGWCVSWKSFDVNVPSLDGAIHEHLKSLPDPLDTMTPPLSMAMIRYKGSVFLSMICHHALYDGVAMENIWREVECLARGIELPPPVPYESFIQEALSLPDDTEDFWKGHFRGFRPSHLFSQTNWKRVEQCTHTASLDIPLRQVQEELRSLGVSLLAACQSSWATVLGVSYNTADICFGNVMSGRTLDIEGLDRLVAPCFNTIPLRVDVSGSSQNISLVKYFQELNTKVLPYQFTPLRLVQKTIKRPRRGLFDTLLLLQHPLQEMDESLWTLEEDSGDMDIPIVCEVVPCPNLDSVIVNIHHDMHAVTGDVATTFAELFKYQFRQMLGSPLASPSKREELPSLLRSSVADLKAKQEKLDKESQHTTEIENLTKTESRIRDVLLELSRVPKSRIRRDTSIFQLGLDSINAVQVASILRHQGYKISTTDVIECPTVRKLAGRLDGRYGIGSAVTPRYDIKRFSDEVSSQVKTTLLGQINFEAVLPCTSLQSAMLNSFIQSHGKHYFNLISYRLGANFSTERLAEAWRTMQVHHPMLRTGFISVRHQDTAFAMIRFRPDAISLPLDMIDPASSAGFSTESWKGSAAARILDDPGTLPWKLAITQHDDGNDMHLLVHHALYDAVSLDSMLEALALHLQTHSEPSFHPIESSLALMMTRSQEHREEAQNFWQQLAAKTVVNRFPVMTPLRENQRNVIAFESTASLPTSLLQNLTQRLDISVQAVLQAAWTRVLASYLGETSVVFGVTLSGRTDDELRHAPLPCLTTVPVVASDQPVNMDLLSAAMSVTSSLHKFQFAPLSQIQKWLGHPATPVFDTLLAYQKMETNAEVVKPWSLIKDDAVVEYPVSMEIEPQANDETRLRITFYSDVLPEEQAELLLRQFDATVEHLLRWPNETADHLHKFAPDIFSISPPVSPVLPAPVTLLHGFVEEKAVTHPDKVALEFVSGFDGECPIKQSWSYHEFNSIGNKIANLVAERVPVGSIVAIHFDKCPEAYFSILGILKAGCSFVALDPGAPDARKEFIMKDSQSPCLLTNTNSIFGFEIPVDILRIDEKALENISDGPRVTEADLTPDKTCYCLYTSGTTGTPKGCEITHDNAVQAMMAFQELFKGHWEDDSKWLQFAALHFDVSVLEQYWSWSVGMSVVAAPKDLILDDLTGTISKLQITHIDLTPSLARLTHPDDVPSLCRGVFITGGEQLKQEILDVWGPKAVIYNAYGPTEATIGVTMYQRVPVNGRPSNIGRQFPNVGSYVFRQDTEIPVLRGGVGELCVSGKLVGKGYLNRPELTSERFPTLHEYSDRVYRTGDLVRMLHDGCFEFLGRADDQVKLRGQRLEIGEINHAIRTGVPEIEDVATIVTSHGSSGRDVLVSFIVKKGSRSQDLQILPDDGLGSKAKAACRARLPAYMVPTYFLRLPYIPLSPNNKAEVKLLRPLFQELSHEKLMALTTDGPAANTRFDRGVYEILLRAVADFSKVKMEEITEGTSLFDLGVDSISAIQLATALRTSGLQASSPATVLRNPVIADLAEALSVKKPHQHLNLVRQARQLVQACGHRYRNIVCRELGIKPGDIEYIAPCSPLQQGIVSKAMTTEGQDAYFNSFRMLLENHVSRDRLRQMWAHLQSSQAILRTAFVNTVDGSIQVAMSHRDIRWHEHRLSEGEDVESFLAQRKSDWINMNKSKISEPLQLLYVTGRDANMLVVHIFHALYDGNSFDVLLRQLFAQYEEKPVVESPSFLEALVHGPLWRYDHGKQFWISHLQEWSPGSMPRLTDDTTSKSVMTTRNIDLRLLEAVRRSQNVTMQSVVMALWTYVLQQYFPTGLTMGVIVSGRSIELQGVDLTIGPLFNTLPFFNKSCSGLSWASLIRKCHGFNTETLALQHTPLSSISKWCAGGKPLFDNLFAFQIEQATDGDGDVPWVVQDSPSDPDFPLVLEAVQTQGGHLKLHLATQGQISDLGGLELLLNNLEQAITSMTSDLDSVAEGSVDHSVLQDSAATAAIKALETASDNEFAWNDFSETIRKEIASLCAVSATDVCASSTVLGLGLDSIDVIKLSAKLRQQNINASPSQIMRLQRVDMICREAMQSATDEQPSSPDSAALGILKDRLWACVEQSGGDMKTVESVLPPTALQESMVASMLQSNFEWYFNHDVLEIADNVDMGRLKKAWDDVVAQSPVLRTGFYEVNEPDLDMGYCQVVFKESSFSSGELDIISSSDMEGLMHEATRKAAAGQARRDLFQLQFVDDGHHKLMVISLAHALYDGWSLGLVYDKLQAAYKGVLRPVASVEAFLTKALESRSEEATQFWAEQLDGVSPTILPKRSDHETAPSTSAHRQEASSSTALSKIIDYCKSQSVSLQALCHACWASVLARLTGRLDVTFGVILSGRDFEGAEDLLFPTMNTVAARSVLHGSASAFLSYLEESLAAMREYQGFPLRKAQLAANVPGRELFNTLFMLQKPNNKDHPEQLLKPTGAGFAAVDYPVCVEAEVVGGQLIWRVACQAEYFTEKGVIGLLRELDHVLTHLTTSSDSEILSWTDEGVQICGLAAIAIKDEDDPELEDVSEDAATHGVVEWDDMCSVIQDVLSQVSNVPVDSIPASTNLYHLGLDSISAIKVSTLLRKRSIHLKPRDLLNATNIQQMARLVKQPADVPNPTRQLQWSPPADIDVDKLLVNNQISRSEIASVLPALPMQVYMMSAWKNSNGAVFFPEFCYRIDGKVDVRSIQEAWDWVVAQSPILRSAVIGTGFAEVPMLQVILKPGKQSPLVQFQVTGDRHTDLHAVHIRLHHALYDGVSLPGILQKFASRLNGSSEGGRPEDDLQSWGTFVVEPTLQSATNLRRQFWTDYLHGCKPSSTLEDRSGEGLGTPRVSYLRKSALPTTSQLRKASTRNGISIQSLFIAAYGKVLAGSHSTAGQDGSVVFGVYLANRHDTALADTYPTLNLVPLRVRSAGARSLCESAAAVQDDLDRIGSRGRADVGLWEVAAWTGVKVASFVNFLTLPDAGSEATADLDVKLVPAHSTAGPVDTSLVQQWTQQNDNVVQDAFPATAFDVEASIQADGALDVGIFGSGESTSGEDAARLVDAVVGLLQELVDQESMR